MQSFALWGLALASLTATLCTGRTANGTSRICEPAVDCWELTRTIKSFAPMTRTLAPCILAGRGAVSDSLRCRDWEPTGIAFTWVATLRREIRIIRRSSCESVGFMLPLSPLAPVVTRFYKFSVNGPGRTETPTLAGK